MTVHPALESVSRWGQRRVLGWRTGSRQSQALILAGLLAGVACSFAVSLRVYALMPVTAYFLWLLLGMMLLRFRPLVVLVAVTTLCGLAAVLSDGGVTPVRVTGVVAFLIAGALILYQSSRQRSGLPSVLSEVLLADLRDRLQSKGRIPPLPPGWHVQSASIAAHGVGYAGDFIVADLREDQARLELVLVDVCGHGVSAAPQSLQFAGALGGLIGELAPEDLFRAANRFLLREGTDETFATAVHVLVDLDGGQYGVVSAGHPPALRWDAAAASWSVDNARGTALGLVPDPPLDSSAGRLEPGDALLFYTDGVVESRSASLDVGIGWLQRVAAEAVAPGFEGAADRIIRRVDRGEDDRAVLILHRLPASAE